MAPPTTVLITGTKSGIGRALLAAYAQRPNHTVIGAIRDAPDSQPARDLQALPQASGSKIIVAQYDAASASAAEELVTHLKTVHQIQALDVVVANAGILQHNAPLRDSQAEDLIQHFRVNTVGPILLYKATVTLLNASQQQPGPKFVIISSALGSNGLMDDFPWPLTAYSMSKAAVNFAAGKIHREEDRVIVLPMQPGWVQTRMGESAAERIGVPKSEVPVTIEDSVRGVLGVVDRATKEEHSGRFWNQEGAELPW